MAALAGKLCCGHDDDGMGFELDGLSICVACLERIDDKINSWSDEAYAAYWGDHGFLKRPGC